MQTSGDVSKLIELVQKTESLDALKQIVRKYRTQLQEIEEEEAFEQLPYGRLRTILEAGRSYFFFKNLVTISYFGAVVAILTMMDLGVQFLFGPVRADGVVVTEALIVVFGALTLIVFAPMSQTSMNEYERQFEAATGRSISRESLHAIQNAAEDIHDVVNAVLLPSEKTAGKEPLSLNPAEFSEVSKTLFERKLNGEIFDLFDATSEGIRVWREKRAGLNPRYLLGPYLITWEKLRDASQHNAEIVIGGLVADAKYIGQLLELEKRL